MSDRDALLAAILEAPDDDALPGLEYRHEDFRPSPLMVAVRNIFADETDWPVEIR